MNTTLRYDPDIGVLDVLDRGIRGHIRTDVKNRNSHRKIQSISHAESSDGDELMDLQVNSVLCRNKILRDGYCIGGAIVEAGYVVGVRARAGFEFVMENGAEVPETYAVTYQNQCLGAPALPRVSVMLCFAGNSKPGKAKKQVWPWLSTRVFRQATNQTS
jgi:hypothetical protein